MRRLLEGLFRRCFGRRARHFAGMAGPTPIFPFGNLLEFWGAKPWDVCAAYEKTYGGVTLFWIGTRPVLVLNDPELIREVLITKCDDYYKDNPAKAFRPVLRTTEFNENGSPWQRLRQSEPMCIEGFDQWLLTQVGTVQSVVERDLERLTRAAGTTDLLPVMERMVYDCYNGCVVGRDLDDAAYRAFYITSNMATKRMQLPNWLLFPPLSPRFWMARRRHFGTFEAIVRDARQNLDSDANDLLHIYLRRGPEVSDMQVAMFLGNIHAGGVFSAGTALVNTLYLLSRHPDIASEVSTQAREVLPYGRDLNAKALEQCPLVELVLRESMRCYPPVPMFFRNVLTTKATQLGKYHLPPNTVVNIVIQGIHRSARYWKDPDRFDPSRWENAAMPLDSDYFLPFGRGPRFCVGATLAMFCMKVMLTTLLARTRVEIDPAIRYRQFFHCGVAEPKGIQGRFVPHS